jgi:cobalt/nickel transport system permease protein
MMAASAGAIGYSVKKVKEELDDKKVPLMGVMGAFVFAGQMINFTIPATGSSGHIGGGILLAALLGPYAAFLVISAVIIIQALFFADGGLLALGCNIFNMGFFACFIAYPLIYKQIVKKSFTKRRISAALSPRWSSVCSSAHFQWFWKLLYRGLQNCPLSHLRR